MAAALIAALAALWRPILAAVAGALAYAKGRGDAAAARRTRDLARYQETRRDADEALRRADGDTRPLDDRLREHGRLRD